jgi:hypothetical protein
MDLDLPTLSNPPSWGTHLHSCTAYPNQKYICEYKKLAVFGNIAFFILKKSEKVFNKLTLGNSESPGHEI